MLQCVRIALNGCVEALEGTECHFWGWVFGVKILTSPSSSTSNPTVGFLGFSYVPEQLPHHIKTNEMTQVHYEVTSCCQRESLFQEVLTWNKLIVKAWIWRPFPQLPSHQGEGMPHSQSKRRRPGQEHSFVSQCCCRHPEEQHIWKQRVPPYHKSNCGIALVRLKKGSSIQTFPHPVVRLSPVVCFSWS